MRPKASLNVNGTGSPPSCDVRPCRSVRILQKGKGRLTKGEFRNFLGQARGSLLELETQLAIARDLGYLSEADHVSLENQCDEVRRMLNGLLESLRMPASASV